jgi:subtilisin family serine protease
MKLVIALLALVAAVCAFVPLQGTENPLRLAGQYIVIYHQNTTLSQAQKHWSLLSQLNVNVKYTYNIGTTFKGFAGSFSEGVLSLLQHDPLVASIHCDANATIACDSQAQNVPSWGLARVSYGENPADGLPDYYTYDSAFQGSGVDAYILDTGIYVDHVDFGGRAVIGANFVDSVATDQNGHGTHCAGTVGGTRYGIAKQVRLIAVKVLSASGSGSYAGIIRGIEFVTNSHVASGRPSVGSMSLGGTANGGLVEALAASVQQGVVYSVAAGNSNGNACNFYPAASRDVITVGATVLSSNGNIQIDTRSSFSNYGTCVHVFAPGSSITSCGISSSTSSAVLSGTSMACPHVTGQVAVELSANPNLSPVAVRDLIVAKAQKGIISNVGAGSPNALLHNSC